MGAVYKLTQSGPHPTMKFGDEPGAGKESVPGEPVLWRAFRRGRWQGVVAQDGEDLDADLLLTGLGPDDTMRVQFTPAEARDFARAQGDRPAASPATQALVDDLTAARRRHLHRN